MPYSGLSSKKSVRLENWNEEKRVIDHEINWFIMEPILYKGIMRARY
jgi:hypothetical protein